MNKGWPFPLVVVYSVRSGEVVPGKLAKFLHFLGFHFWVTLYSFDPPYPSYLRYCKYPVCSKRQARTDIGWEDY